MKSDSRDLKAGLYVFNPEIEVDQMVQNEQYFAAFALSVSCFEILGKKRLRKLFENDVNLGRMGVRPVIRVLYGLDLIEKETFENMKEVIKIRNDLIHMDKTMGLMYNLTDTQKSMIEKAKKCLIELRKPLQKTRR